MTPILAQVTVWLAVALTIALRVGDFDPNQPAGALSWPVATPLSLGLRFICRDSSGDFSSSQRLRTHHQLRTQCPGEVREHEAP